MTPVLPGIGDVGQVSVPTPQVFFDNQPVTPAGRSATPDAGNFSELPAFVGNAGKPEGSQPQV